MNATRSIGLVKDIECVEKFIPASSRSVPGNNQPKSNLRAINPQVSTSMNWPHYVDQSLLL